MVVLPCDVLYHVCTEEERLRVAFIVDRIFLV